jgi:hypothetical protein
MGGVYLKDHKIAALHSAETKKHVILHKTVQGAAEYFCTQCFRAAQRKCQNTKKLDDILSDLTDKRII